MEKQRNVDDILAPEHWSDLSRETGRFANNPGLIRETRRELGIALGGLQPIAWVEGPRQNAEDSSEGTEDFVPDDTDEEALTA